VYIYRSYYKNKLKGPFLDHPVDVCMDIYVKSVDMDVDAKISYPRQACCFPIDFHALRSGQRTCPLKQSSVGGQIAPQLDPPVVCLNFSKIFGLRHLEVWHSTLVEND